MESHSYNVYFRMEVMRVASEGVDANEMDRGDTDEEGADAFQAARMVATRVLAALCECQSGADAHCHHIAMLLQLLRLLQMSSREISEFDPTTVTGRDCQWIMNHAKGGREAEHNVWWGLTFPEVHVEYSKMRDPKGQLVGSTEGPLQTAGVVQGDRLTKFNPHPGLGGWAEARQHFDEGTSISEDQNVAFGQFFASVKAAKLAARRSKRNATSCVPLAVDTLPPLVR